MSSSNLLLRGFPSTILLQLISSWIHVETFVIFDCALCNQELRNSLFNKLVDNKLVFKEATEQCDQFESSVKWLVLRGFSANKLTLNSWRPTCYGSNLTHFMVKVREVCFSYCNKDRTLLLNDNELKDFISFSFMHLESLEIMKADKVTEVCFKSVLSKCVKLRKFSVTNGTFFTTDCLALLGKKLPDLLSLELENCNAITSFSLIMLAKQCRKLQELHIFRCSKVYGSAIVGMLKFCPDLKDLLISRMNEVNDEVAKRIGTAENLTSLDIGGTDISGVGVYSIILGCKKLKILNCYDISGAISSTVPFELTSIDHCGSNFVNESLEVLDLSSVELAEDTQTEEYKDMLEKTNRKPQLLADIVPNLTELDIQTCDKQMVEKCGFNKLTKLKSLIVSHEDHVGEVIALNRGLKTLRFDAFVKDFALLCTILSVSQGAANLTELQVANSKMLIVDEPIDDAVALLVSKCSNLTVLDLSHTSITDKSLEVIVKHCKRIDTLTVNRCASLSAVGLADFVAECDSLTVLSNETMSSAFRPKYGFGDNNEIEEEDDDDNYHSEEDEDGDY